MKNLVFYTERYNAVNILEGDDVILQNLPFPLLKSLDGYIYENVVNKILINSEFQNIFIPLSPFNAFTDYLGLRLALFIKLCDTPAKLSNIFIYGSEPATSLFRNECFEVLKFPEVKLINFSKEEMLNSMQNITSSTEDTWYRQINEINLPIPEDYYDSHSIANEWGIYQMARNANIKIEEIEGVDLEKFNKLYFRWLIAKNKLSEPIEVKEQEEQRNYGIRLNGLTILGKIELP